MNGRDHERALELVMRHGTEELAGMDEAWLQAHLAECPECAGFAGSFQQSGEWFRGGNIVATRNLVTTTQAQVRARALQLEEHRSRMVLIAIAFCLGMCTSAMSGWLWWKFGAWVAERAGLSLAIVQPGIFVAWMLPSVVIAIAMLLSSRPVIDRSLVLRALGEEQEGVRQ